MTRGDVLEHVAKSDVYTGICKRICGEDPLWRDLFQELIIILHNQEEGKLVTLYTNNQLRFFVARILLNQYKSTESPFYRKIKKFATESVALPNNYQEPAFEAQESDHHESVLDLAEIALDKKQHKDSNDWYECEIVNNYIKTGSLRKLEAKTGISRNAISEAVSKFKTKILDQKERLAKLDQLNFITGAERFAIKKQVISQNLDVDEVIRLLKIKHKICLKKSICGIS